MIDFHGIAIKDYPPRLLSSVRYFRLDDPRATNTAGPRIYAPTDTRKAIPPPRLIPDTKSPAPAPLHIPLTPQSLNPAERELLSRERKRNRKQLHLLRSLLQNIPTAANRYAGCEKVRANSNDSLMFKVGTLHSLWIIKTAK